LFADQILWLQIADTSIIGDVAARKDKFEASFFIIQFLLTLAFLTSAGISLWFWKRDIGDEPLPTQCWFSGALAATLFIRSFSEVIISIRSHLQHHTPPNSTPVARDTVYGLCTFAFFLVIDFLSRDASTGDARGSLRAQMAQDARRHILRIVEETVGDGKSPPHLRNVIQNMRQNPDSAFSQETLHSLGDLPDGERGRLRRLHAEYVGRLSQRYGDLTPPSLAREF